jgi:hypothetical protein
VSAVSQLASEGATTCARAEWRSTLIAQKECTGAEDALSTRLASKHIEACTKREREMDSRSSRCRWRRQWVVARCSWPLGIVVQRIVFVRVVADSVVVLIRVPSRRARGVSIHGLHRHGHTSRDRSVTGGWGGGDNQRLVRMSNLITATSKKTNQHGDWYRHDGSARKRGSRHGQNKTV